MWLEINKSFFLTLDIFGVISDQRDSDKREETWIAISIAETIPCVLKNNKNSLIYLALLKNLQLF